MTVPAPRPDNAASFRRLCMLTRDQTVPNDLEALWMPFTANRHFKAHPRMITRAEGMHYVMADGRRLIDATVAQVLKCAPEAVAVTKALNAVMSPFAWAYCDFLAGAFASSSWV